MSISDPTRNYAAVTKGTSFPECSYLWVGTAGTLIATCPVTGQKVTFTAATGWMPVRTTLIDSGSSADAIVACYAP